MMIFWEHNKIFINPPTVGDKDNIQFTQNSIVEDSE